MKNSRAVTLFESQIYLSRYRNSSLMKELIRDCITFSKLDTHGQQWSKKNYPKGYTSYSSITDLHQRSTGFETLAKWIQTEVKKFSSTLSYDLKGGALKMTTFWINLMNPGAHHAFHIHPLSTISGTFYLQTDPSSPCIRFEDPRLVQFMSRPSILPSSKQPGASGYFDHKPSAGDLVLFESFMKHEVPVHHGRKPRISVSFNFEWVQPDRF